MMDCVTLSLRYIIRDAISKVTIAPIIVAAGNVFFYQVGFKIIVLLVMFIHTDEISFPINDNG